MKSSFFHSSSNFLSLLSVHTLKQQHSPFEFLILRLTHSLSSGVFFVTKSNGNVDVWDLMDRCVG